MTDGNDWAFHETKKVWGYTDKRGEFSVDNENTPLTKREYFAAMAMQGLLSDAKTVEDIEKSIVPLQQCAVVIADALIDALNVLTRKTPTIPTQDSPTI